MKNKQIYKLLLSFFIGASILLTLSLPCYAENYKYKDPSFKLIVDRKEQELESGGFPSESIEELTINDYNVWSLEGIQNLSQMYFLNITKSSISDLEPISNLENLNTLIISDSCIKDLTPIKNLKNLKYLSINNCDIEDFSALNSLTDLLVLQLINSNVKDISFMKSLNELRKIDLIHNYINNIEVLSYLPNLRSINLYDNYIENLSPLKDLIPNDNDYLSDLVDKYVYLGCNFIDRSNITDENKKVIKNLEDRGYNVYTDNCKKGIYPVKINGKKYMDDNKINGEGILSIEFDENIEKFKESDIYYCDGLNRKLDSNDYEINKNTLYINMKDAFKKSNYNSISITGIRTYPLVSFEKSEELFGDANKNGTIDLEDLSLIAKDYNKNSKDADFWNYKEDINRDGIIDIYDLKKVSLNIR